MGTYFIGIDYGTVHTKVCVREDIAALPSIVPVRSALPGAERYLLPSIPSGWTAPKAPKVLLCEATEQQVEVDDAAMAAAIRAVAAGVEAAVAWVARSDPGRHDFIIQLGLPTEASRMIEVAKARYQLAGEAAIASVRIPGIQLSVQLLDERLASLALLDKARIPFQNEPLLVVDGGGWTTHISMVRWITIAGETRLSIHGDRTAIHGVHDLVGSIHQALPVDRAEALRLLGLVTEAAYEGVPAGRALDLESALGQAPRLAAALASSIGTTRDEALRRVTETLRAFRQFSASEVLAETRRQAWYEGYGATPGAGNYRPFRLVLTGGACRIGRSPSTAPDDPIAHGLVTAQRRTQIPFTQVLYPELDERFWAFDPAPEPSLVPYFLVAGGYSYPLPDWPVQLRREAFRQASSPVAVECGCSGLSDSCPHCAGNGFRRSMAASTPQVASRNREQPLPPRQVISLQGHWDCTVCRLAVPSIAALDHFLKHTCPECRVPEPDLADHLCRAHGFEKCHVCGEAVRNLHEHQLQNHLTRRPATAALHPSERASSDSRSSRPSRRQVRPGTGPRRSPEAPSRSRPTPSVPPPAQAIVVQEPVEPQFTMAEVIGFIPPEVLRERLGRVSDDRPRQPDASRSRSRQPPAPVRRIPAVPPGGSLTHRPFAALLKKDDG